MRTGDARLAHCQPEVKERDVSDGKTLPDGWLAKELASIGAEVALWSDDLKESFNSLPGVDPIPLGLPPCPHCGKRREDVDGPAE